MQNHMVGRLDGFTLIELLVVVLIIWILASVALLQYEKAVEKSRVSEAMIILKKIADNVNMCLLSNGGRLDACGEPDIAYEGFEDKVESGLSFSTKNFDYVWYGVPFAQDKKGDYMLTIVTPQVSNINNVPAGRWCMPQTEKGVKSCKSLSGKDPITDNMLGVLFPF